MAQGYPEAFVNSLEMHWGVGFLSPGGPEEVREILKDIDISGKKLLDIGCGTGGPAMVIAGEGNVRSIVGIDIEAHLIERGKRNVAGAGLDGKIDLRLVDPGPLLFDDGSFDIVFSKDALVHIEDKAALYREILRVLIPGGRFAASDWLRSDDADDLPEFVHYRALTPISLAMHTAPEAEAVMRDTGFTAVSSRDRNAWYAELAGQEVTLLEGPLRERFIETCGVDAYEATVKLRRANAQAAACGGLRPTHLHGSKPAARCPP